MFCATVLAEDSKNYHVWSHRQHVVRACHLWDKELTFVANMIAADVRNNSAWNQRMFVLQGRSGGAGLVEHVIMDELAMASAYILCAPNNEAPWAYVSGLAGTMELPKGVAGDGGLGSVTVALATVQGFGDLAREVCVCGVCDCNTDLVVVYQCVCMHSCAQVLQHDPYCVFAHALLADVYAAQARVLAAGGGADANIARANALALLCGLQDLDPLRRAYWSARAQGIAATGREGGGDGTVADGNDGVV